MEFYLAKKQNKTVTFAGKWMELEVTMLSEICKSGEKKQKEKYQRYLKTRIEKTLEGWMSKYVVYTVEIA